MTAEMIWWTVIAVAVEAVVSFFVVAWFRRIELPSTRRTMFGITIGAVIITLVAVTILVGHTVGAFDASRPPEAVIPQTAAEIFPAGPAPTIESKVQNKTMNSAGDEHQEYLLKFESK